MEKLANLKGAKALNRSQQKEIIGGTWGTDIIGDGTGGPACNASCQSDVDCDNICGTCVVYGFPGGGASWGICEDV